MLADELHPVAEGFRAALRALVPDGQVRCFRIDALDRIGVPVVQAALTVEGAPAMIGYGYGLSAIEAEVGALGEVCEETHAGAWMAAAPRVRTSYAELLHERGEDGVCDPLTLCLPAGSAYHEAMPLDWVMARRWPGGEAVLVPRDWVAAYRFQLGGPSELITPITNGLGAGFDLEHALAHALMELLQRDGNVTSFRALDQGVVVDLDGDDAVPGDVRALLERLREAGVAPLVKLAGIEFGIADLYVVGDDPDPPLPIQVTACGEAYHPDLGRALRKALLEFAGSRARKAVTHGPVERVCAVLPPDYAACQLRDSGPQHEEPRALAAMAQWVGEDAAKLRARLADSVFAERRRVRLSDLPHVPAPAVARSADRLALLARRLGEAGLPILFVDHTAPGAAVRVVRAIVPGLESETMSYGRIGWRGVRRLRERRSASPQRGQDVPLRDGPDALLRDNHDALLRDAPAEGCRRVRLRPQDEALAGGPAWFDAALAERLVGGLYPLYRETGQFSAQMARAAAGASTPARP